MIAFVYNGTMLLKCFNIIALCPIVTLEVCTWRNNALTALHGCNMTGFPSCWALVYGKSHMSQWRFQSIKSIFNVWLSKTDRCSQFSLLHVTKRDHGKKLRENGWAVVILWSQSDLVVLYVVHCTSCCICTCCIAGRWGVNLCINNVGAVSQSRLQCVVVYVQCI